jgi:hypothetical protein
MRKWIVTHTLDAETFKDTEIEGTSYTDAYINFRCKYPKEDICELKEACDG